MAPAGAALDSPVLRYRGELSCSIHQRFGKNIGLKFSRLKARQVVRKKQTAIEAEFLLDYIFITHNHHAIIYVLLEKYQFPLAVLCIRLDYGYCGG
jgi:hypothetical protein